MGGKSASPAAIQILDEVGLRNLPAEWTIVRIENLLSDDRRISVGVMYPGDHDPLGVPLIKAGDLSGNSIASQPTFRVSKAKHHEYRRTELMGGELLISLVGDVGRCAVVQPAMVGWNAARAIAVLRFTDATDAQFVRLCLLNEPLQHLMRAWSTTTVQATLNLKEIRQLPLPWPPKRQRNAIAHILDALDDKIELNRRMNETLEAMARALFKSWFVDFDPVHAKRARRGGASNSAPDLPAHIADLFPDSFEDSDLGPIPKGWRVATVGDVCEFAYGRALKAENRQDGLVPVFGSNGQVGWHNEVIANGPGVIVGRKGNPGVVTWCATDFFAIDTTFYIVPTDGQLPLCFLFHALRQQNLASLSADSAVPGLNRNMAYMSKLVVPPRDALAVFSGQAETLAARVDANEGESRALTATRDALLPRLLSGELRVKDAERFVEVAR